MAVRSVARVTQEPREVGHAGLDVVVEVARVDAAAEDGRAEPAGGGGHQLHDADGAHVRARALVPAALLPRDGAGEGRVHPVAGRVARDQGGDVAG